MIRNLITFALATALTVSVFGCGKSDSGKKKVKPAKPAVEAGEPGARGAAPADKPGEGAPATAKDPKAQPTDAAPAERITGPVAKVNTVPIPSAEFYQERDKITSRNAKIPSDRMARIEQNILKRLVEKELIRQAIEKATIKVEAPEIDAAFAEYKKRFQTDQQFENYLKHGKVTVESIKKRLEEKRALEKLIEAQGNLAVTDEEAKEFYEKNQRFYLEKGGMKASHILVKLNEKASPDEDKAAMDKIKKVQKELKAGKDFGQVAKEYSEGPSAPKGGDLGYFGKGQMVKPFEEAAAKLKKNQVSGPVRTRFGYHIIKLFDRREERKKPFAEVNDQITQSLRNKKFFQERRKLLQKLREDAKIEKFIKEPPPSAKRPGAGKGMKKRQPGAIRDLKMKTPLAPRVGPRPGMGKMKKPGGGKMLKPGGKPAKPPGTPPEPKPAEKK